MTNSKNISVVILDYGSGNVSSVYHMLKRMIDNVIISRKSSDIDKASHLILPGVGAFSESMDKIKNRLPLDIIEKKVLNEGIPFLGICVGMQVLFDKGSEFGCYDGLGWISGEVEKISNHGLPIPHIGWNNICSVNNDLIENNSDMYFVHSYRAIPSDEGIVIGRVNYGENLCAAIKHKNILGVQFHPEKSQSKGMDLIAKFLEM